MATAYRLLKARYRKTAFTGEGARRYGGRWNFPGTPMVYLATSVSLAVLETLVHLGDPGPLSAYVLIPVTYPPALLERLDSRRLPADWDHLPATEGTRRIGEAFVARGRRPLLRVPSAVVPEAYDLLLNPAHPDAGRVRPGPARAFRFDPRLLHPGIRP